MGRASLAQPPNEPDRRAVFRSASPRTEATARKGGASGALALPSSVSRALAFRKS